MTASSVAAGLTRRPSATRTGIAAIGVLAVLVAGCGGGTPAGTAAPTAAARSTTPTVAPLGSAPADTAGPNATDAAGNAGSSGSTGAMCTKVTTDEMTAIVGSAVTVSEGSDSECTWATATFAGINLRIEQGSPDLTGQKLLFTDGRDISGVGERAFWAPSATVLYAIYHGKVYAVQLVLFAADDAKNLGIATSILQKALSRI